MNNIKIKKGWPGARRARCQPFLISMLFTCCTILDLDDCLKEMDKEDEEVQEYVDDSQLKDDEYWLFKTENFKGIWKQMDFEKGEEFDVELITIYVNREEGENLCSFEYDGDELDGHELSGGGVTEEIRPL